MCRKKKVIMVKHRKSGRPKGSDKIYGCARKITVYRRKAGRIVKTKGFKHKACFD